MVALNPASQQWARDVGKTNEASQQALTRVTLELANANRALQDSITRMNRALEQVRLQNEYILSLVVAHASTVTGDVAIAPNTWTTNNSLRPSVQVMAPTGRIRIIISGYGHNAMLTYSIPGTVSREQAISSYLNQSAQLTLPGGAAAMTSQKEWVQYVPTDQIVTVQVECRGVGDSPIVASPSLIVQVIPA